MFVRPCIASSLIALAAMRAIAEEPPAADERAAVHFQATVATQAHPSFHAAYSGRNSLSPDAESATSVVMDLSVGVRLLRGTEIVFQPELAGGRGLSSTLGVAAFPSGEVYRVGDPTPGVIVGRAFLRQVVGLGGGRVCVEGGLGRLSGERDRDALTVTVGKVAVTDFVDSVPYSNDPHTRFMSWGLWASAAYDYPADTRGYTWGASLDVSIDQWSARAGVFLEPKEANGIRLQWDVVRSRGLVAEVERRFTAFGRDGAARVLGFFNEAPMGSYRLAVDDPAFHRDVSATRAPGRTKGGVAASANLDFGAGLGAFVRASWNDGRNETWAFTEIDRSLALGAVQSGSRWARPDDEAGAALVVSGLSDVHRRYLESGGYGFLIGDGALDPAAEILAEIYYRLALTKEVSLGGNYQPIVHPAYNRDRGPVHVFSGRVHVAF
jgi:high affinity Mn2+ porin